MVDVLIPVYNGAKYIERCIRSLLRQTYQYINIIVLDDGSIDDSLSIIQRLSKEDGRIKIHTKPNEKNVSAARNYLLNKIESDYFIFVDVDDVVSPYYIEGLMKALKETNSAMACCEYTIFKSFLSHSHKLKGLKVYNSNEAIPEFVLGGRGHYMLWNKLIKTSLIQGIRFNKNVGYGEDMFFILDVMYSNNVNVASIKNKFYYYKWFNYKSISKGGINNHKKIFLETLIKYEKEKRYGDNTRVISTWIYLTATYFHVLSRFKKDEKAYLLYLKSLRNERKKFLKEEVGRLVSTGRL